MTPFPRNVAVFPPVDGFDQQFQQVERMQHQHSEPDLRAPTIRRSGSLLGERDGCLALPHAHDLPDARTISLPHGSTVGPRAKFRGSAVRFKRSWRRHRLGRQWECSRFFGGSRIKDCRVGPSPWGAGRQFDRIAEPISRTAGNPCFLA